jgi:elongation factor Ts
MAAITAQMVKELREKSGAGMMDCKKALTESDGNFDKAMSLLRERGEAIAVKRGGRVAKEGLIEALISDDHHSGVLIELNSESDFVARNDDFKALAAKLAKQALAQPEGADVNASSMEGTTAAEVVKAAVGKIGENIVLSRTAKLEDKDGIIVSYVHPPGKIGVLVDFAVSNHDLASHPEFKQFARSIAMHVAASSPLCLSREDVPAGALENEKEIFRKQALNEGKPEKIVEKIVEGRVSKFYGESCLLEQPFVQDPDKKVEGVIKENAAKHGAEITIRRYVRFLLGESAAVEEESAE